MVLNKKLLAKLVTESITIKHNYVNDMLKLGNSFSGFLCSLFYFPKLFPNRIILLSEKGRFNAFYIL